MTGASPADYTLADDRGTCVIKASGDWTVLALGDAPLRLAAALARRAEPRRFDAHDLGRIDTAGAFALMRLLATGGAAPDVDLAGREELRRLADLVGPALDLPSAPPSPRSRHPVHDLFDRIGRATVRAGREAWAGQVFAGHMMIALGRSIAAPRRLRVVPLVATMEQAGLNALPIVIVMTFFIGAILALVGSTMLTTLGVKVYAVELVGIGILREFGAVIAAILFAGRSASAFAAQLGSMRMAQEIDAMQVMGIDVFDALVVPRILAALIMLPLLTLVGDFGGIVGGMAVTATTMDISPIFFLQRLVDFGRPSGDARRAVADVASAASDLKVAVGEARGVIHNLDGPSRAFGTTTMPTINATMLSVQQTADTLDGLIRQLREDPRSVIAKPKGKELELPK